MRTRHRRLVHQAAQAESSLQSRLSSYRATLKLLDADTKKLLRSPPVEQGPLTLSNNSIGEGFYALNPARRTLDMAKEQWREEVTYLREKRAQTQSEIIALRAGRRMWRAVLHDINDFEGFLKNESLDFPSRQDNSERMTKVLGRMDTLLRTLQTRLQYAQENNWNLLMCCIGAEWEALREGQILLTTALEVVQKDSNNKDCYSPREELMGPKNKPIGTLSDGSNESLRVTLEEMIADTSESKREHIVGSRLDSRSESENDDPGPGFLLSHT